MIRLSFIICILFGSLTILLNGETKQDAFFSSLPTPTDDIDIEISDLKYWSFQARNRPEKIGKKHDLVFRSTPSVFRKTISLAIQSTQYLRQFELELACENTPEKRRQLIIKPSPVVTNWKVLTWKLPEEFKGESLVVEIRNIKPIHENTFFLFSSPFEDTKSHLPFSPLQLLWNIALALLMLTLLLLPAFSILTWVQGKDHQMILFPLICIITAILGIVVFWSYFIHSYIGIGATLIIYLVSILQIISSPNNRTQIRNLTALPDIRNPLILIILSYLVVISTGFLYGGWDVPNETAQIRYLQTSLPHDNILPYILTERFFQNQPTTPFFHGWLSSDRPPLQVAMVLLLRTFLWNPEIHYHIVSVLLQCLLTPAIYILARSKNCSEKTAFVLSLSLVFSSSFLLNGFFVWPKLLPAAFMLLNTAFLFSPNHFFSKNQEKLRSIFLGTTTTLAMLAHGGSLIGIFPLYVIGFLCGKLPRIRYWGWIILPFVLGMTPWILYQKLVDPPGNRLVLWHLGGFYQKTDLSPIQVIIDQYRSLGWQNWLHNKTENLKSIWGNWNVALLHLHPLQSSNGYYLLRSGMFLSAAIALLPQIMILPLIPISLGVRSGRKALWENTPELLVFILGLFFWTLLIFGPARTILHQGTYYLPFIFCVSLYVVIANTSRKLLGAALLVNWVIISVVWVFPTSSAVHKTNWLSNIDRVDYTNLTLYIAISAFYLIEVYKSLKTKQS